MVLPVWCAQRDISKRLIAQGKLGRKTQNHAMNGWSPTLWLEDADAPEVGAALWAHPGVQDLVKLGPGAARWLSDEEADRFEADDEERFIPQTGDRRRVVERQIRERRGQRTFRDKLRQRYGDRCLVTGCEVLAVLEAAHIQPYRGEDDNHPENGLLLRADIHTLFDLDLLGINPVRLVVELHPDLAKEYGQLSGKPLGCSSEHPPSLEALQQRYEQFRQRLSQVA